MCELVSSAVATHTSAMHCPCILGPTNDRGDFETSDDADVSAGEVSGVNKPLVILATAEQSI